MAELAEAERARLTRLTRLLIASAGQLVARERCQFTISSRHPDQRAPEGADHKGEVVVLQASCEFGEVAVGQVGVRDVEPDGFLGMPGVGDLTPGITGPEQSGQLRRAGGVETLLSFEE